MARLWTFRDTPGCINPAFWFCIEYSVFPEHSFEMHFHDFTELVIVRHGRGLHTYEDRQYTLTAGDVFVIAPNEIHGYNDIEGLDLCNLMFDFKHFLATDSDIQHLAGFHALFHLEPVFRLQRGLTSRFHLSKEQMLHLFHNFIGPLEEEYRNQNPAFESMIRAYLTLAVGYLSRNYIEQETPVSHEMLGLSRARSFIEANYQDDISLQDMADVACMSKNTLLRTFAKYYGVSPIKHLIRHRLTKAGELLRNESSSVTDVAYLVGFSDSSYFARQFRKVYGLTPREFKKRAT